MGRRARKPAPRIELVGYLSGNLGLGVAARHTLTSLERANVPTSVVDVDPGYGRHRHEQIALSNEPHEAGPPIRVYVLTVGEALLWWLRNPARALTSALNVVVVFWELDTLTDDMCAVLRNCDVVLAPSRFIAEAVQKSIPEVPVVHFPQAVDPPLVSGAHRDRWGLDGGAFVVVSSLDWASDPQRKNPSAVVAAFQRAFPDSPGAMLVLRINSVPPEDDQLLMSLRDQERSDPRIRLVTEPLTYTEVQQLLACADVVMSLHRSEGFGLVMAEAMAQGKPVVATGYSGNLDFMNEFNSLLVRHELVAVQSKEPVYMQAKQAQWAEPDISHAAEMLRQLADDPSMRIGLGETGRVSIAGRQAGLDAAVWTGELKRVWLDASTSKLILRRSRLLLLLIRTLATRKGRHFSARIRQRLGILH